MTFLDLLILSLATLYLAQAITSTDGPFYTFRWLRDHTRKLLRGLFDCIWCTAFWVGLAMVATYFLVPYGSVIVSVPAVAGAALVLRSYSGVQHG